MPETEVARRSSGWAAPTARAIGLAAGLIAVAVVALLSLRFGSLPLSTRDSWDALFHYNPDDYEQVIVRSMRLPRTLIAICVGGSLAVAGTVMQGVTRNPLADPSILGVSQGASLGVAIAITYLGASNPGQYVWVGFLGAMLAAMLVFAVGTAGRGGAGPIKLALAGVVVAALLSAWTSTLLLMREETMDSMRFWLAGSVAGRGLDVLKVVSPFLLAGTIGCLLLGHQLNVLSMGDDSARALGMRTGRVRVIASIIVVIITGAAVAVAGPIGFVGLMIPHTVRLLVGNDQTRIIPLSVLAAPTLLLVADTLARVVVPLREVPVGIVTALIGGPVLIALIRNKAVDTQ